MLISYITRTEFCDRVNGIVTSHKGMEFFKLKSLEYMYDYLYESSETMNFSPVDIHICWREFTLKTLCQATGIAFGLAETDFDRFLRDASDALNRTIHEVDSDTFLIYG